MLILVLLGASYSHSIIAVHGYTVPKEAKYLVAFFEFKDLTHTKSIDELRTITQTQVQSYYAEVSYGKLKLTADVVPNWIQLPLKVKQLNLFQWNYNDYDVQTVDGAASSRLAQLGIKALQYVIIFVVYAGKVWPHASFASGMAFENEFAADGVFRHELGHALGHLPDMYSYRLAKKSEPVGVWVGPWDIMGGSWGDGGGGFSSWSLIRLGWIDKNQITYVNEKTQKPFTIDALGNASGRFYVALVHLPASNFNYYVEVREKIGVDADWYSYLSSDLRLGVVIYLVDETWAGGAGSESDEGQVRVVDSHPHSYTSPDEDLYDAPFNIGRGENATLVNHAKDLSIIVLNKMGYSYKIMVADAATGDRAAEANRDIGNAEGAIFMAQTSSRLKGLDDANNQLSKAKSAYSEAQFADAIQAAKTAIDLANAASTVPTATSTLIISEKQTMSTPTQTTAPSLTVQPVTLIVAVLVLAIIVGLVFAVRSHGKRKPTATEDFSPIAS